MDKNEQSNNAQQRRRLERLITRIDRLQEEAATLAEDVIENEARAALRRNPQLHEFVMAMGSAFFVNKANEMVYEDFNEIDDLAEFFELVRDLNERYNIKGFPMRIVLGRGRITDW